MSWGLFSALQTALWELEQNPEELLQNPLPDDEKKVSNKLSSLLRKEGYRTDSLVNLWKLAGDSLQNRNPVEILKTFQNPLQPDVDLLVEDHEHGNKLSGFEIKIIRWDHDSFKKVVPKGRIYAGLDQALALTTYGLDYVCLWHIFTPSRVAYRKAFEAKGHIALFKWMRPDNHNAETTPEGLAG